jgi:hypothetical protein
MGIVRPEQTVSEMVQEVLTRQARALVERTGQTFERALEAVSKSEAGRKLVGLSNGSHREEKASEWQEGLLRERTERLVARFLGERVVDHHYSWLEGYLAWLKGKEAREGYYTLLEHKLGHLKG